MPPFFLVFIVVLMKTHLRFLPNTNFMVQPSVVPEGSSDFPPVDWKAPQQSVSQSVNGRNRCPAISLGTLAIRFNVFAGLSGWGFWVETRCSWSLYLWFPIYKWHTSVDWKANSPPLLPEMLQIFSVNSDTWGSHRSSIILPWLKAIEHKSVQQVSDLRWGEVLISEQFC